MEFALTAYAEKKILNFNLLGETYTPPPNWYLALFTGNPGREGSLVDEVTDPVYERLQLTFTAAADDSSSGSFCANTHDLETAQATIAWGEITHVMLMDAGTGGNGWFYGELGESKSIGVEDFGRFPAGYFRIKLD